MALSVESGMANVTIRTEGIKHCFKVGRGGRGVLWLNLKKNSKSFKEGMEERKLYFF